jgi:hypothetical protein
MHDVVDIDADAHVSHIQPFEQTSISLELQFQAIKCDG